MPSLVIRDMEPADEYYVSTCTHEGESDEIDACARRRLAWLKGMYAQGLRVKVALRDDQRVGFLYLMPIEVCPWGPLGRDLMAIPCLVVQDKAKGRGVGRALIEAAEEEARAQGRKGLVTEAYYWDSWFMPAPFFERCGFSVARSREVPGQAERGGHREAILWKLLDASAETPRFLKRDYRFEPVPGKVVVDLFYNTFCETSDMEAQRVREVVEEFGDRVVLREYCADDRAVFAEYQTPRAIYVNGREIWWGYEAPREGIREAIRAELSGGRADAGGG